jgi:hypothetical protein
VLRLLAGQDQMLRDMAHLLREWCQTANDRDAARRVVESLAGRVAGQSELLGRRAERKGGGE